MTDEEAKTSVKPIPIWKWVLLHFCPTYISYDTEGDIACVFFQRFFSSTFTSCVQITFVSQQATCSGQVN